MGMGMGMKSLKWKGIGTKNLFPHTSNGNPMGMGITFPCTYPLQVWFQNRRAKWRKKADMLATTAGRFGPLPPPALNLLTQHHAVYPATVGNLLGLRSPLRRDRGFLGADPVFPGEVGTSTDGGGGRGSPMNLSTAAARGAATLQLRRDSPPPAAWPIYRSTEPTIPDPATDPAAAAHGGVGVFQRLLALMSRRASVVDSIRRRYAPQPLFWPTDSPAMMSLSPPTRQKLRVDRSEEDYPPEQYMQSHGVNHEQVKSSDTTRVNATEVNVG